MAAGGPPDRLNARHQLIAMLVAAGHTHADIARHVGMSATRIGIIAGSPLFQALVREYQGELLGRLADVTQRLHAEALPTLTKLVALRDSGAKEEVQLGAANSLADRIPALAKKVKTEEERTVRLLLGHDVEDVFQAIAESRGEVYVRRGASAAIPTVATPATVPAPPLDELLASWETEGATA